MVIHDMRNPTGAIEFGVRQSIENLQQWQDKLTAVQMAFKKYMVVGEQLDSQHLYFNPSESINDPAVPLMFQEEEEKLNGNSHSRSDEESQFDNINQEIERDQRMVWSLNVEMNS